MSLNLAELQSLFMSAVMQHRPVRIPTSLQAVLIASSRGKEVNDPPPSGTASKVFFRNWRFQQKPPSAEVLESRKRSTSDSSARSEKAVSVHVSSQEPKGIRRSLSSELVGTQVDPWIFELQQDLTPSSRLLFVQYPRSHILIP